MKLKPWLSFFLRLQTTLSQMRSAAVLAGTVLLLSQSAAPTAEALKYTLKDPVVTREERVLGLATVYSMSKKHFAGFDRLPDLDWDKAFMQHLPLVEKDQSLYEYYRVLQRFIALLEDGHTTINFPQPVQQQLDTLPIRVDVVEGKWIVSSRFPVKEVLDEDIPRGSELISIEGRPPEKYYAETFYPYIAASREQMKRHGLAYAFYPKNTPVKMTLRLPNGSTRERVLIANRSTIQWTDDLLAKYLMRWSFGPGCSSNELESGILYIAFRKCDRESEKKLVEILEARKSNWPRGLILDLRANPGGNTPSDCIRHLISKESNGWEGLSRWSMSYMDAQTRGRSEAAASDWLRNHGLPDRFSPKWYRLSMTFTPAEVHYDGPLVLLTSPTTGSAAEDPVVVLQQAGRGKVIGDRTAGVTGQPISFDLPGGGTGRICTMKVCYSDGREFQGIGCKPDILVTPTIKGITEARDEVLEAALKCLRTMAAAE